MSPRGNPPSAVMLLELELSEVLRHPGLIEVLEAAGLGLDDGWECTSLAFGIEPQVAGTPASYGAPRSSGRSSSRFCGGSESMRRPSVRSFPAGWAWSAASAREYDDD